MAGCLRRSRVVAEKRRHHEEKSAHNGQEARPKSLKGRESNDRNPETGAAGKKNEKNSDALDTGGAHAVTIGDIPSVEWFQVHPNGISRSESSHKADARAALFSSRRPAAATSTGDFPSRPRRLQWPGRSGVPSTFSFRISGFFRHWVFRHRSFVISRSSKFGTSLLTSTGALS